MSYCISEFENGEYRITFDKYDDFERVTKLIANEEALESHKTEKECSSCKCKEDKEISKHERCTKPDIPDLAMLNSGNKNDFGMILEWGLILCMMFLNLGNHDSYYKGMCDAYEKIFTPGKQEENMQKARAAFAELKKLVGDINKNDIS